MNKDHKHIFKLDKTRKHKRPGFYFAKCECGEKCQAVVNYGVTHFFKTNRSRGGSNVISLRVNNDQKAAYNKNRRAYDDQFRQLLSGILYTLAV